MEDSARMTSDIKTKELDQQDKFVAMATASAEVDLKLSDFKPVPMLVAPVHTVNGRAFPPSITTTTWMPSSPAKY